MLRSFNPKRQADRARQVAERRIAEKAARRGALLATQGRAASMGPADLAPAPKAEIVRSEAYRRVVALLPCRCCGIAGYSQAAHGSQGKGMALKASDLELFPLCSDRPDKRGCHSMLDQGALYPKEVRRTLETAWARDTQRQILTLGLWPKDLPVPEIP
ncbi:hypothetical protein GCM10007320_08810 [Pseudorhodoferax aquiterrae]|uniref:DUF968 domain-containing protein n=1 Tax=Pseudorhodoferax aquiterrae TaxID=747304 RepID=A0ABQ3FX51_9BURK|nr:hypothetical protein [Pseudorhodoferax aquiterrae]GHC72733.1 hypothetical protein GCM10007320_08810 [Pseudorhodoferax aquiterrae]